MVMTSGDDGDNGGGDDGDNGGSDDGGIDGVGAKNGTVGSRDPPIDVKLGRLFEVRVNVGSPTADVTPAVRSHGGGDVLVPSVTKLEMSLFSADVGVGSASVGPVSNTTLVPSWQGIACNDSTGSTSEGPTQAESAGAAMGLRRGLVR